MFESLQSLLSCTQISISSNPWLLCNSAINKSWRSGDHRAHGKVSSDEPRGSFQSQLPDANEGHPTEIGVGAHRWIDDRRLNSRMPRDQPSRIAKRIRKRSQVEAHWSSINPVSKHLKAIINLEDTELAKELAKGVFNFPFLLSSLQRWPKKWKIKVNQGLLKTNWVDSDRDSPRCQKNKIISFYACIWGATKKTWLQ